LNKKLEIIDDISLKIREASEGIGENIATGAIVMAQKKEELEKSIEATKEILDTEITEMRTAQQIALDHRRQALDDLRRANRELLEATYYGQKRILKAFPGLKSINHKEALEKLKNLIG
jgi:hypothetical protein